MCSTNGSAYYHRNPDKENKFQLSESNIIFINLNKANEKRDGMGREEGGGFRMGNTCIPVADSF